MAAACASPVQALPHTVFPNEYQQQHHQYQPYEQAQTKQERHVNFPPPPPPRTCFSPQLTRDHYQSYDDESAAIQNQVRSRYDFPSIYEHYHITNTCYILVTSRLVDAPKSIHQPNDEHVLLTHFTSSPTQKPICLFIKTAKILVHFEM